MFFVVLHGLTDKQAVPQGSLRLNAALETKPVLIVEGKCKQCEFVEQNRLYPHPKGGIRSLKMTKETSQALKLLGSTAILSIFKHN